MLGENLNIGVCRASSAAVTEVNCDGEHPICSALSQQGLNRIKLLYDRHLPDQSTASACRELAD